MSALSTAEGRQISSGQAIAVLDSSDMDNAVQSAYESVRNAQLSLENQSKQLEDYAVAALRAGDDIKTVQGNLGHHTASFTLDVYGHVTEEMKQASAVRMDSFIKSVSNL